jgi:probable HAF family extracellular repeat protein
MTDLGTLSGTESVGIDVTNLGQIVGNATTTSGETHAFLYQLGVMTDLGTLGGDQSSVAAINNHGVVADTAQTPSGEWHATVWRTRCAASRHRLALLSGTISLKSRNNSTFTTYPKSSTVTKNFIDMVKKPSSTPIARAYQPPGIDPPEPR